MDGAGPGSKSQVPTRRRRPTCSWRLFLAARGEGVAEGALHDHERVCVRSPSPGAPWHGGPFVMRSPGESRWRALAGGASVQEEEEGARKEEGEFPADHGCRRDPPPHVRAGATLCVRGGGATVAGAAAGRPGIRRPLGGRRHMDRPVLVTPGTRQRAGGDTWWGRGARGRGPVGTWERREGHEHRQAGPRAPPPPVPARSSSLVLPTRPPPGDGARRCCCVPPRPIPPGCRALALPLMLAGWPCLLVRDACARWRRGTHHRPPRGAGRVSVRPPRARQRGWRCRPVPPRCARVRERRGDQLVGSRARFFPRTGLPAWTAGRDGDLT
ncbi:hypothetical protein GQ55_2G350200 [Panicum hallii var. hallii]|uniref:Uncharacterized protein n=1 Tax=Panicum hallii var. hallii TaxID=1504633 RepID=A0A2T7EVN3_9POAL|nr:hypothetical protein GQ55_2G350200 [Panicum hallii var. hallii]